jgi:hypothetical protein
LTLSPFVFRFWSRSKRLHRQAVSSLAAEGDLVAEGDLAAEGDLVAEGGLSESEANDLSAQRSNKKTNIFDLFAFETKSFV